VCGRFVRTTNRAPAAERELGQAFELQNGPSYNVAPGEWIDIITFAGSGYRNAKARWGFLPAWSKEPRTPYSTINARSESVANSPAFRAAFRNRRCLVPASGFYEWARRPGSGRQPYYIRVTDDEDLAFAGLWETWGAGGADALDTCTILTTAANALVEPLHNRMPVILDPSDYVRWLDPALQDPAAIAMLLRPYPPERMQKWPVGNAVNNTRNNHAGLISPVDDPLIVY